MAKYVNLTEAINIIRLRLNSLENSKKQEIRKIEERYQRLIDRYKAALEALEELNEVCPNCEGLGTEKYIDASGNHDTRQCNVCGGTGLKGVARAFSEAKETD